MERPQPKCVAVAWWRWMDGAQRHGPKVQTAPKGPRRQAALWLQPVSGFQFLFYQIPAIAIFADIPTAVRLTWR